MGKIIISSGATLNPASGYLQTWAWDGQRLYLISSHRSEDEAQEISREMKVLGDALADPSTRASLWASGYRTIPRPFPETLLPDLLGVVPDALEQISEFTPVGDPHIRV